MDHEVEAHRVAATPLGQVAEQPSSDVSAHKATPVEMLRQLARQLRTSQPSQLSAKDPYGTTFPGLDDAWVNDDALRKKNAQYFIDLRASMDLSQVCDVVTEDIQAILKRLDAELEVAKYKFADFVVSLGLLPLATLKRGSAAPKDQHGGLPTVQAPAPWQRLLPDWRRFVPTPPMVVAGGPGGTAALDGWQDAHALHEDTAYEIVMPVPDVSTAIAAPRAPVAAPRADYRETVKQIFFDYNANVRPDRARLFARLEVLLTNEVGISHDLWARLKKLHPSKLEVILSTKGFLDGAASSNPMLRDYVARLTDVFADTDLSERAFRHYIETAKALVQMPEATDLQRVHLGGNTSATYSAIVDGQKVFLKMAGDPEIFSNIYRDLQAGSDMMKLSPRDAVRWYLLVRVHDGTIGWREAVAMEPLAGDSLSNLSDKMYAQQALPFPIGIPHVRAVRKFQEDARMLGFNVRDEHDGNVMATDDAERPIVPVDMTVHDGNYFVQAAAINPFTIVRELAEYTRLSANGNQPSELAPGPTPQDLAAAEAKLKQLFAAYQAKKPRARDMLLNQLREVLTQLGVDDSICSALLPTLDYSHLRTLLEQKAALEGLASPDESHRMHAEDLAWEYGADRLPRDLYERDIGNAQSVSALPPVIRLRRPSKSNNYVGRFNGRPVHVRMPLDPRNDSHLDKWISLHSDQHPFLVRVLDPKTRVWRRAAAWYED